jgi:micrococcal nuclease
MVYDYRVQDVLRVVDGDTVDLRLDLGFYLSAALRFRLLGCDTPERHEVGWHESTEFTKAWLAAHEGTIRAETLKADSFGRWLTRLYVPGGEDLSEQINAMMAARGYTSPAVR